MGDVINITKNEVEAPVQMLYADILAALSQLSMQAMERITEEEDF